MPRVAATSVLWAALSGIGASFLATAVIFTLLMPVTLVDFAPLSRERAFELSGLAGSAAAIVVARVAGGWRAVAIVALCLGAAVCYAIWRSIQAFDFCLRALCPMFDYAPSHLDAVIRQWPAAAGAALGLLTSLRTWAAREGTNALLEATGALALSTGLVTVVLGFDDARAGPIIVLAEAAAPMYIALFIGSLTAAAIVVGIRSATPLLSGVRFVAVVIAVEAPLVVQEAFQRGPRELKGPILAVVIPLAAALGVALVSASLARVLRSPSPRQPLAREV